MLSLIALPLMNYYSNEQGLKDYVEEGFKNQLVNFSMGNLGFAETECYS